MGCSCYASIPSNDIPIKIIMSDEFLWVSKYSPKTIDECILPQGLKDEFNSIDELANMLFIGDAGVGKTTVANILCATKGVDLMFMNASMERGIDEVRTKIQTFASTVALFGSYKVILLDEADNLTPDAQKALRALVEHHQNNCRFILTCNYPYKLIDPLKSRLQEYYFTYPDNKTLKTTFVKRMLDIMVAEKVALEKTDVPHLQSLVGMYYPNWRKVIHQLQRCCASGSLDASVLSKVQEEHISTLFSVMKAKNFTVVRNWIAENMAAGVSDADIVKSIYTSLKDYVVPQSIPQAVLVLADYQQKAAVVANQEINTVAMAVELMMQMEFK